MKPEEYQQAAHYWDVIDAQGPHMEREELRQAIESYLLENDTCALATGHGDYVRCTPIEYSYVDGVFYIFTEGGKKFLSLAENNRVSLAVFDKFAGFTKLRSVQVMGRARVIPTTDPLYAVAAKARNINLEALAKRGHGLYLIQVIPERFETIQSAFKGAGYSVRQVLEV